MSASIRLWLGPLALVQIGVLAGVVLLAYLVWLNIAASMRTAGLTPGFAFLGQRANFEIGESLIDYLAGDSYGRALIAGLLNTAKVAVWGCLLATMLGTAVALAGLLGNRLLGRCVRAYIDVIRGTPLLLQLFVWTGIFQSLPAARNAFSVGDLIFLSNRGVALPLPMFGGLPVIVWLSLLALPPIAIVLAVRPLLRGRSGYGWLLTLVFLGGLAAAVSALWFAGYAPATELPVKGGFNIRGGITLTPEFAALLTGLVVNSSATIAEVVRSGIQAVKAGQLEAAKALGLRPGQTLRLVVWPQALRVIVPLMTSSYLDLTKNSSLAVAIGYPDLVSVTNTTANTTGQAVEAILLIAVIYLSLNLLTSFLMNIYNRRVALRGENPR